MKILFLTPQLPHPPRQGAAIRNWQFIAGLAGRHTVDLLTFGNEADISAELRAAGRRVALSPLPGYRGRRERLRAMLQTRLPDMARRLWSPPFAAELRRMLAAEDYDWVQIEGLELAPYIAALRAARPGQSRSAVPRPPRLLFDEHNAEYVLQRRAFEADLRRPPTWLTALYSLVQWDRLRRYEAAACRAATRVVAVSEADRRALLVLDRALPVTVVPNGVDLAEWNPHRVEVDRDAARLAAVGPLVVFDGSMDFRPNGDAAAWFVAAIWPLIRSAVPLAQFAIVGRNPTARVQALAGERGVVVTGLVPDSRGWVAAAAVYVVPMRIGGGVRLKVLQALAMERAIVSTALGCEGIAVTDGQDVLLAEGAAPFAAAVIALLQDPAAAAALGPPARALAAQYAWSRLVPRLEEVLRAEL